MRVGLVVTGDIDSTSGGFYYDRRLRDRLHERGHGVTVVSIPWRSYPRRLVDNLRPARLKSRLTDVDVLLEDGLAHPSLITLNRQVDQPTVALLHMLASRTRSGLIGRGIRQIESRFCAGVDAAVCNAEATRRDALALGGPDRCVVAPPAGGRFNPSVSEIAIRDRATNGPLEITYLGNVVERKGLDTLLDGLQTVTDDWRLTVVGDTTVEPAYVDRVQEQVAAKTLANRVTFAGRLADDAVADRLHNTHVLAVPSRYEPFGIVYLEAMGFGCVPVATTAGGASEFIVDGESGVLVAPDDDRAIAATLERLAENRTQLAEMAVAARDAYDAWPTWTETLDVAIDFLQEITDESHR